MAKLTVKELEAVTTVRVGEKLREEGGLVGVVRVRGNGVSIKFDWRYRFAGKVRSTTCGTWPKDSMPAIRGERDRLKRLLEEGRDPAGEKLTARLKAQADQAEAVATQQARLAELAELEARVTVRDLFDRWATVDLIRRKDGGKEVRRMFEKDVLPSIAQIAVEDVRKGNITAVTDALLARGVTRMAKQIFSLVRQMFRFAVDRDIIEADPTASIRKAKIGGKDVERDRVLSEEEIRALHRQIPGAGMLITTEAAVWLCLATCCRIGELLKSRWEHVDLERATWRIPAENSKNGKAHAVFLSPFAVAQFRRVREINSAGPWCYPDRSGEQAVSDKTITKQLGDRQRSADQRMSGRSKSTASLALPNGKWTPHDLRRTGATLMTKLGVIPEVAERCLNHTEENRVKRIYQRHSYEGEMREAWNRLGKQLELLTSDEGNVVTLIPRGASVA
jgi:integrase